MADLYQIDGLWYGHHLDTKQRVGPFAKKLDAFLAESLGTSVESMMSSAIKQGLIEEDGKILTPADFTIWHKLRPENR